MNNRHLILVFFALVWGLAASAQNRDKGLFIELSAAYSRTSYEWADNGHALIIPSVGYRFASRWSVGARVQIETRNEWDYEDFTSVGFFGQYRFLNIGRFNLFAEAQLSCYMVEHNYSKILVDGGSQQDWINSHSELFSDNYAEAGVTFGASYRLWRGLRLTARYLYLGYSGASSYRRSDGCWGDGGFVLDAGWNRLQVGLQYTF